MGQIGTNGLAFVVETMTARAIFSKQLSPSKRISDSRTEVVVESPSFRQFLFRRRALDVAPKFAHELVKLLVLVQPDLANLIERNLRGRELATVNLLKET